jgi:hypothetical protein
MNEIIELYQRFALALARTTAPDRPSARPRRTAPRLQAH